MKAKFATIIALAIVALALTSPADAGFLFGGRRQAQRNAFNQGFQQGVQAQARAQARAQALRNAQLNALRNQQLHRRSLNININ